LKEVRYIVLKANFLAELKFDKARPHQGYQARLLVGNGLEAQG